MSSVFWPTRWGSMRCGLWSTTSSPPFSSSPCPEVIFGALSRLTKNIKLGFGVVILPYHHPVRVAERVAMVDQLSNGRVEFGTGRSAPYEQVGMGIDPRGHPGDVGRIHNDDPQDMGV